MRVLFQQQPRRWMTTPIFKSPFSVSSSSSSSSLLLSSKLFTSSSPSSQKRSPLGNPSSSSSKQQKQHKEEFVDGDQEQQPPLPFYATLSSQARAAITLVLVVLVSLPMLYQKQQADERNRLEMLRIEEQVERELDEEFARKKQQLQLQQKKNWII